VAGESRSAVTEKRLTTQQTARVHKELSKARAEMKAAQARTSKLRQQVESKAREMDLLRQTLKTARSS
jgi:hypothetical protein